MNDEKTRLSIEIDEDYRAIHQSMKKLDRLIMDSDNEILNEAYRDFMNDFFPFAEKSFRLIRLIQKR